MPRIVPHNVPRAGRSYKHFPDGFELHLLPTGEGQAAEGDAKEGDAPSAREDGGERRMSVDTDEAASGQWCGKRIRRENLLITRPA